MGDAVIIAKFVIEADDAGAGDSGCVHKSCRWRRIGHDDQRPLSQNDTICLRQDDGLTTGEFCFNCVGVDGF